MQPPLPYATKPFVVVVTRVRVDFYAVCGNQSVQHLGDGSWVPRVYQDSWDATIREQLPQCKGEPGNHKDLFGVAVVKPLVVCQRRYRVCAPCFCCVVVQFTTQKTNT